MLKKLLRESSLRTQAILVVTSMLLVSLVIIGIFFIYNLYSIFRQSAYSNLRTQANQMESLTNSYFNMIDTLALREFNDQSIYSLAFDSDGQSRYQKLAAKKAEYDAESSETRYSTPGIANSILSAYLFLDEDNYLRFPYFSRKNDPENINVFKQSLEQNTSSPIFFAPSQVSPYFYYVRNPYNRPTETARLSLVYCIFEDSIFQVLNRSSLPESSNFLMAYDGTIYSAQNKNELGEKADPVFIHETYPDDIVEIEVDGVSHLALFRKVAWGRLILVTSIPRASAFADVQSRLTSYLIISVILAAVCVALCFFILRFLTRFINNIVANMEQIAQGNYQVRMDNFQNRDLGIMSRTFNAMAENTQHLVNEVYRAELMARESELRFLQSQMNPHFLFNVLTNIRTKAKLAGNSTVNDMLLALNQLLRAGIYTNNDQMTTLENELEYVRQYLYLQKMRFEDGLEYSIFVGDPSVLGCRLPKLSVEAIVENAVVHGIENKVGGGRVEIQVLRDDEKIYIAVADDGIGFDSTLLDITDDQEGAIPRGNHNQIGLKYTNRRFKLTYGDEYGIRVESSPGAGTCIVVSIPLGEEEGHVQGLDR